MPEGDSLRRAVDRIRPVLLGHAPTVSTQRLRADRIAGREVVEVSAYGKHLFIDFGELAIHSHLGMVGTWRVDRPGGSPWLTLATAEHTVTQHRGPTLELLTVARRRQLTARLGPDILAPEFDARRALRNLRGDDPTRAFGDALLDQRSIAGIGNIWKCESCWETHTDPWRRAGDVRDDEILAVLGAARAAMQDSVAGRRAHGDHRAYGRAGRPCPRCGGPIRATGQGEANRTTYWCPGCQT